jgi:hypothetical protein
MPIVRQLRSLADKGASRIGKERLPIGWAMLAIAGLSAIGWAVIIVPLLFLLHAR